MKKGIIYKHDELANLQNELLGILKEIKIICDKHNIPFFAVGGTLLGAVRHKGFIPWDDDIDIGMLRDDYDKFIDIAKKELPEQYFVLNFKENNHVPFCFTKICKKDTLFVEYETRKLKYPHCIFVDIMPYDNTFSDQPKRKKHLNKGKFYHQLFKSKILWGVSSLSSGKHLFFKKVSRFLIHLSLLLIPKKYIFNKMEKQMEQNNGKITNEYITFWSEERFANPKNYYFPLVDLKFEDIDLKVPNNYDKILKKQYGDYMKLPPENKRVSHSPYIIKF